MQIGAKMEDLARPQPAPVGGATLKSGAVAGRLRQMMQKQLHPAAALFDPVQPGGKDPGVVNYQQIIGV